MDSVFSPEMQRFVNYLEVERHFSVHTLRAYLHDIAQFCNFVEHGPIALQTITGESCPDLSLDVSLDALRRARRETVRSFLAHVQTAGNVARTSARKLAALRTAYRFFIRENLLEENPAETVRSPKLPRSLPEVLSIPEVTALLEAPDLSMPLGIRDRAILETLYSSGVRAAELAGLRIGDLDLTNGVCLVLGKRKKQRIAHLRPEPGRCGRQWRPGR